VADQLRASTKQSRSRVSLLRWCSSIPAYARVHQCKSVCMSWAVMLWCLNQVAQLDIEHRDGIVIMDGDKTEQVAEFVRCPGALCAAIGVRTFAPLENWEEEQPIRVRAFANIPPCQSLISSRRSSSLPGDGRHDDDTRQAGPQRKRVVLTWAWHPSHCRWRCPIVSRWRRRQIGHQVYPLIRMGTDLMKIAGSVISRQGWTWRAQW